MIVKKGRFPIPTEEEPSKTREATPEDKINAVKSQDILRSLHLEVKTMDESEQLLERMMSLGGIVHVLIPDASELMPNALMGKTTSTECLNALNSELTNFPEGKDSGLLTDLFDRLEIVDAPNEYTIPVSLTPQGILLFLQLFPSKGGFTLSRTTAMRLLFGLMVSPCRDGIILNNLSDEDFICLSLRSKKQYFADFTNCDLSSSLNNSHRWIEILYKILDKFGSIEVASSSDLNPTSMNIFWNLKGDKWILSDQKLLFALIGSKCFETITNAKFSTVRTSYKKAISFDMPLNKFFKVTMYIIGTKLIAQRFNIHPFILSRLYLFTTLFSFFIKHEYLSIHDGTRQRPNL